MTSSEMFRHFKNHSISKIKIGVQELVDIYRDRWRDLIKQELRDQFLFATYEKLQLLVTQELNLVKRVVKDTSLVYKNPAIRKAVVEGTETVTDEGEIVPAIEDEAYEEVMKESPMDLTMLESNRFTNLTNEVMFKVVYRNNKIDYDMYLFDNIEVMSHPEDWKKIVAVKYYVGQEFQGVFSANADRHPNLMNDPNNTVSVFNETDHDFEKAYLYTLEDVVIANPEEGTEESVKKGYIHEIKKVAGEEQIIKTYENPYRDVNGNVILPFVLLSKTFPVDQLLDFSTGNDVRDANINLAVNLVHLNALIKFQSWKQVWIKLQNKEDFGDTVRLDPAVVIKLFGEGSEIGTVDIESKIKDLWEVIKQRVQTVLSQQGISPENFTMSGTPESGFALKISNMGKLEARETQLPLYRNYEHAIFEVVRSVHNYHRPENPIDVKAKFIIDFGEITFPKSPEEEQVEFTFKKSNNVVTPIDLIMKHNPDLTEEQAEALFIKNKGFNSSLVTEVEVEETKQPGEEEGEEE